MSVSVTTQARRHKPIVLPAIYIEGPARIPVTQTLMSTVNLYENIALKTPELAHLSPTAQAYKDSIDAARVRKEELLDKRLKKRRLDRIAATAYEEGYEAGYEDGSNRQRNESFAPKTKKKPYYSNYCFGYYEGYYDGYMDTVEDYAIEGIEEDDDEDWELEDWEGEEEY